MGLIYSYQVFVDPARAPDLFTGLVPMLEPEGVTELRFGGGRTVNLPCTSLFEEDRTIVVDGGEDSIDAFDLDLVMRFDGIEEPIGYVYGTYDVVDALWRFSFSAAT
ncbi:MAG TPA: hypothetical protein VF062_22955, partial [Candidatus Limnocylindrales bacterium]